MDGDAELPAAIPGSEQGIPVSIRSNVRVGLQRQAGDRGVRSGTVRRAVRHHLPYMSQQIIHRDLRKGGSERTELALPQSDRGKETRSLRFPLDSAIAAREDETAGSRRDGRRRR